MDVLLDVHMRKIRNIQFCSQELEALLPHRTQKIVGTTLDAFAAVIQNLSDGRLIARGEVRNHAATGGNLEDHITAACRNGDRQDACLRSRWGVPLCGGTPAHWVLGCVDFDLEEYGIVDSIPELRSSVWAEPLLRDTIEAIRGVLGLPQVDWHLFSFAIRSPAEDDRQTDDWSCGLYVMIAMQAFLDKWSTPLLGASGIELVRESALQVLLKCPVHAASSSTATAPALPILISNGGTKRKLTDNSRAAASDGNEDVHTDDLKERSRVKKSRSDAAKGTRASKTTAADRERALSNDEWVRAVQPHQVHCHGCGKWIALHKSRQYDLAGWNQHRQKCARITGVAYRRVAIMGPKDSKGARSPLTPNLSSYFVASGKPREVSIGAASSSTPHLAEDQNKKVSYLRKGTTVTPAITKFYKPLAPTVASPSSISDSTQQSSRTSGLSVDTAATESACSHLRGEQYLEYILRTHTRSLGGVSRRRRGQEARRLFPYKPFPELQADDDEGSEGEAELKNQDSRPSDNEVAGIIPADGNSAVEETLWTPHEQRMFDEALRGWARWQVNVDGRFVKSAFCHGTTVNKSGVCEACATLAAEDYSFKKAVYRKSQESKLPREAQHAIQVKRGKFTPNTFMNTEARELEAKLHDPVLFAVWQELDREDSIATFITLWQQAREGKLATQQKFIQLCEMMSEQVKRHTSENRKAKHGIRYPRDYLNFMTLMRSYGQQSSQQYSILREAIGGPTARTLRYVIKRSPDCLSNPDLQFENMARVKRLVDMLKYDGPIAIAGDCTKVRQRLMFSNDYGNHILGSTLPLAEVAVDDTNDIDNIVVRVAKEKRFATQVRAILVKVPLPQVPPLVIALLPTKGNDTAPQIFEFNKKALAMAAHFAIPVVSMAADGAATELGAQSLMDAIQSEHPPLMYEYPLYGVSLRAPVFEKTGPLVSIQDPQHARKTCRNQPQHGTHTASMGAGYVVNRSLVQLYETYIAGLQQRNVKDVDKQDDGAAHRLFHAMALRATTHERIPGVSEVKEQFTGLFVYLFVFGELFDAWLNRRMTPQDRILAALRTRFFLHVWKEHVALMSARFPELYKNTRSFISPASFNIFNRLCDSLVLLALAYCRHYPDKPFCPWQHGTHFVEHFFGLARTLLPDFTYAELLKLIKHVMLRQHILLSGEFKGTKERNSRSGYLLDYDAEPLTPEELLQARVKIANADLDRLVELAFKEASAISKQILKLSVPSRPWSLAPIVPPPEKRRKGKKDADNASDSEDNLEEDDLENLEEATLTDAAGAHIPLLPGEDPSQAVAEDAAQYTARYAALSADFEATLADLPQEDDAVDPPSVGAVRIATDTSHSQPPAVFGPLQPSKSSAAATPAISRAPPLKSKILDESGKKIVISKMLDLRDANQSGTATRSERVIAIDQKFALSRLLNPDLKMSIKHASHHLRVVQAQTVGGALEKTTRERRWQETAKLVQAAVSSDALPNLLSKNVSTINPLRPGCFVIMKNKKYMYIGELLDLYKKVGRRHGSLDSATTVAGISYLSMRVYLPLGLVNANAPTNCDEESDVSSCTSGSEVDDELQFSCRYLGGDLYTHAPEDQLLYNLGPHAMDGPKKLCALKPFASSRWHALRKAKVQKLAEKALACKTTVKGARGAQSKKGRN